MKFQRFLILIILNYAYYVTNAQDTIVLKTFEINEYRKQTQDLTIKVNYTDSITKKQFSSSTLTDLLSQNSQLFIKNYGPGSLATTAFRGASAVHTAILWNGININSSMNGLIDLSLLPVFLLDEIAIQYGGTTALWGSGAVAGSIQLNNHSSFNKGFSTSLGTSFGSFDSYSQFGKFAYSKNKLSSAVKFTNTTSLNNFDFINTSLKPSVNQKQLHAAFQQQNILIENILKFSEKFYYSLNAWHQQSQREIPPVLFQENFGSTQNDVNTRIVSELKYLNKNSKFMFRNALLNEQIKFYDFMADKNYNNKALNSINEAEHYLKLNKHIENHTGLNYTYQQANSEGYLSKPILNRLSFFNSWNFRLINYRLLLNLSYRKEWMLHHQIPLTYSLATTFNLNDILSFKTNSARVYRIPTFNDLFWNPGGNPNLKPEDGFTHEGSFIIYLKDKSTNNSIKHTSTYFTRIMKNWIVWLPENAVWKPQNLMEVWSRGVETESELNFSIQPLRFMFLLSTSYVVSTSMKALYDGDNSVDKQLIYVPMYSGQGNFRIFYKNMYLNYNISYTGYRYTSTDNSQFLNPYWISNIWFAKSLQIKKSQFEISARINNLFNENYQVMLNRPMPLRNYQLGIRYDFN